MIKIGDLKSSIVNLLLKNMLVYLKILKVTYQKGSTSEQEIVILKYILNIGSYKIFYNLDTA